MFMVRMETSFPPDMDPDFKADLLAREKAYGQKLQESGKMKYLWRIVGPRLANVGIYEMSNEELQEWLAGLPMRPWLEATVTPIATHPSALKAY